MFGRVRFTPQKLPRQLPTGASAKGPGVFFIIGASSPATAHFVSFDVLTLLLEIRVIDPSSGRNVCHAPLYCALPAVETSCSSSHSLSRQCCVLSGK